MLIPTKKKKKKNLLKKEKEATKIEITVKHIQWKCMEPDFVGFKSRILKLIIL